MKAAGYRIEDFKEGDEFSFKETITKESVDTFAEITGDSSPLHVNEKFAVSRGFEDRVVHGVLLAGYFSRLAGVHFPGENCLLQTLNLKFSAPAYTGDEIEVSAVVDQVSISTNSIVLKLKIKKIQTDTILVSAKAIIGFTKSSK
jgi:3-hydroxybutyryl-CoA dehydratase